MKDRELVEEIIFGTFPLIRDLVISIAKEALVSPEFVSYYKELTESPEFIDYCREQGVDPSESLDMSSEPSFETSKVGWNAPLTDMVVQVLWVVLAAANGGVFIASESNVANAIATINIQEVVHDTGLDQKYIPFVLAQVGKSLIEVVRKHALIEVEIDRQVVRLISA